MERRQDSHVVRGQDVEGLVGEIRGHESSQGLNHGISCFTVKVHRQPWTRKRVCCRASRKRNILFSEWLHLSFCTIPDWLEPEGLACPHNHIHNWEKCWEQILLQILQFLFTTPVHTQIQMWNTLYWRLKYYCPSLTSYAALASIPVKDQAGHVVPQLLGFSQAVLGQQTVEECQTKLNLLEDASITS